METGNNSKAASGGRQISVWLGDKFPAVFVHVCEEEWAMHITGGWEGLWCQALFPRPVTVSDHVIVKAALELLRLGIVKGQFVSLFKLYTLEKTLQMVCELIKCDKVWAN